MNATPQILEKAVIYARFSSHGQTEQSIEGQLHDCHEYAKRNGYIIVDEYIDRALTGRYDDRPSFQKMVKDSAKKQFQFIIVWKLDRFARNRYDSAMYKHILKKNGVRVISAMEQVSQSPEGIILEALLEANAEYYSENLAQNVKRGQRESCEKGLFLGGNPGYGYKVVDKKVQINEEQAEAVKIIFNSYLNGLSKKEIAEELNKKGYRTNSGNLFKPNNFQDLMKNPKYTGTFIYGGKYECNNMYPQIITKELFDNVQKKLSEKAHRTAEAKAKINFLLSGKLFCGECGTAMIGDSGTSKSSNRYYYYSCGKRKRERNCPKKTEKKDFIEWYVCEQTSLYVLRPEIIKYISKKIVESYDNEFGNKRIKSLESKISKAKIEKEKVLDKYINTSSKSILLSLEKKIEDYDFSITDMEIDLAKLKIGNRVHLTEKDIEKWLLSFSNGDLMDMKYRERLIETFVDKVFLYDERVVIYYNITDGKQVSYIEMLDETKELDNLEKITEFGFEKEWQGH